MPFSHYFTGRKNWEQRNTTRPAANKSERKMRKKAYKKSKANEKAARKRGWKG